MNATYTKLIDILSQNNVQLKFPIMLSADQFDTHWTISVGWTGTGVKIAKTDLTEQELSSLVKSFDENNPDMRGKVILNKIFEARI